MPKDLTPIQIIPAILSKNFDELEDTLSQLVKLVPYVQIDVCDGKFVLSRSWPYQSVKSDNDFEAIISEERGFPFWDKIDFEVDLMVSNPEEVLQDWVSAGASRVIIHVESISNFEMILSFVGVIELGLAINIDTPNEILAPFENKISVIQCMGINKIGFQGQLFDERVISKISELRKLYPNHVISVDGGVSLENASKIIEAGANRLVVGSALWQGEGLRDNLAKFKKFIA